MTVSIMSIKTHGIVGVIGKVSLMDLIVTVSIMTTEQHVLDTNAEK